MKRFRNKGDSDLEVEHGPHTAAGITAVAKAMELGISQMGVRRTAQTLLRLNQVDGFDCRGCAWPDPDPSHRHTAEFCENGAKAVAEEATRERVGPEFFAEHSVEDMAGRTEFWLGKQGRITEPMVLRAGATHYEPITRDDAFATIAGHLQQVSHPDEAVFYTSGKASNEAAFVYQLFSRAYGTNNLPDCSNMCHESSGTALVETIGIGKGSVSLDDIHRASLIVVAGQNPGTNHPRMLSALEEAKGNGAKIISINPLEEPGLVRFKNPQRPRGVIGTGTPMADLHLPIRINGDLALFRAIGALLVEWDALDHDFPATYTEGFEAYAAHVADLDWAKVERSTGLTRARVTQAAEMFRDSDATITCWAMGITQHHNSVAVIKEIVNVAMLRGQHRATRCRAVPGARPLQRAGRPHDGRLGAGPRPLPRRTSRRVRLRAAALSTAMTPSRRSARCATARCGCSSARAATSSRPPPTPRSPSAPCATAPSPCTSRPSSTARTSSRAARH
ncbi:molybdopterin-dependent oxidoreductase [Nocardioides sp. B-3]|uniref:molybdopterin-dependent oxidoreductase n=1 Tax=Nocardioides sp. B-3 TaxID=2895565 RepID=UPI00300E01A8